MSSFKSQPSTNPTLLAFFPHLPRRLYAMALEGYWMDVGQPKDYLTGGARA